MRNEVLDQRLVMLKVTRNIMDVVSNLLNNNLLVTKNFKVFDIKTNDFL